MLHVTCGQKSEAILDSTEILQRARERQEEHINTITGINRVVLMMVHSSVVMINGTSLPRDKFVFVLKTISTCSSIYPCVYFGHISSSSLAN